MYQNYSNNAKFDVKKNQSYLILSCDLCLEGYELVAEKKKCDGPSNNAGSFSSISECATSCKNNAPMFIFGTNDFGDPRCSDDSGKLLCRCHCETGVAGGGTCNMLDTNGYRLYKFVSSSK